MNFYEILGVDRSASSDDIRASFSKKLAEYSRDVASGSEDAVKMISDLKCAKNTLTDPGKRAEYDKALQADENCGAPVDLRKSETHRVSLTKPVQTAAAETMPPVNNAPTAEQNQPAPARQDGISGKVYFITNAVALVILIVLMAVVGSVVK
ncbi:MAG: J domain-containing protein [Oscillospiraceae bacterium]|nr:J domain-containing protein [Oscillospiraceae bacterium]